ncbi:hypothetical protein PENSPDRAFT_753454 [Peniophora sp. CONT]|nr:hypothetical protein PENSPDRAFT_753454 [Peniophora sp. CONT]
MARFAVLALFASALVASVAGAPVMQRSHKSKSAAVSATATAAAAAATSSAAASNSSSAATSTAATQTAADFQVLDYADFQISSGVAGNAEAEANAVFVDPFANTDLSTVSADVLDAIQTMREAAEDAETSQFNPAIAAASGADADALQVGKIKNKVLKLTGEVQGINIKIAQAKAKGSDTTDLESSLAAEQKKLTTNIATDVKSAGATSQSVV